MGKARPPGSDPRGVWGVRYELGHVAAPSTPVQACGGHSDLEFGVNHGLVGSYAPDHAPSTAALGVKSVCLRRQPTSEGA